MRAGTILDHVSRNQGVANAHTRKHYQHAMEAGRKESEQRGEDGDDDELRNLAAERARAVAMVGSLHHQLTNQLACRQETRYQQIVAGKEEEEEEEEECSVQVVQDEAQPTDQVEEVATPHGLSLMIGGLTPDHGLALDDNDMSPLSSPSSSVSNTPYVTPPDSPTMLRWRFLFPLPSLLTTTGTQTDRETGVCLAATQTDISQPLDDTTAVIELSERGVNTEPPPEATPTLEATTNTAVVCVNDNSVNTELSVFELLRLAHEAENTHNLQEQHKAVLKELNEEKSKRMVNEHLVQIIQSDLTEVRQHNVAETTTRLRLENNIADLKVSIVCEGGRYSTHPPPPPPQCFL